MVKYWRVNILVLVNLSFLGSNKLTNHLLALDTLVFVPFQYFTMYGSKTKIVYNLEELKEDTPKHAHLQPSIPELGHPLVSWIYHHNY